MAKRKVKPYLYRMRPAGIPDYNYGQTVIRTGDQEQLTGLINDEKASDLEERSARAMGKLEVSSEFRVRITSEALGNQRLTSRRANVRGEIEIDFLAEQNGQITPIFVDGEIGHFMTPHQADIDKQKADIADEFGAQFGWRKSIRIPFWKLIDQDMADRTYREIFV
jgi:hypothetical protein